MGSVSSVSTSVDEEDLLAKGDDIMAKASAESFAFFPSSVSMANSTMREHKDLVARLAALDREGVEFGQVQIYRQPLSAGVADHHQLVYWRADIGAHATAGENCRGGFPGLQIDWGQNGLAFSDCKSTPQGRIARSKEIGVSPLTISHHLQKFQGRPYSIVNWNCQHFSQELYDKAGGNSRLNAELDRLQKQRVVISSVSIYQETPGTIGEWTLVYWYNERNSAAQCGLQISYGPDSLDFEVIIDEPPGALVRWRECSTSPARIRRQLREIEGRQFDINFWNSQLFTQHLFDRIMAKGGIERLHEHLEELADRGVEIAGVLELSVAGPTQHQNSGDHHVLIYKYRMGGGITYLCLDFSECGVRFSEADEEPINSLVTRNKPMLFVRLQPKELQRQVREIQGWAFNPADWSSLHFCNHLFVQVPGRARDSRSTNRRDSSIGRSHQKPDK